MLSQLWKVRPIPTQKIFGTTESITVPKILYLATELYHFVVTELLNVLV